MQPPAGAIVALYWEARASSPEEGAQTLLPVFGALGDAGFCRFFLKGRSRALAKATPFAPSLSSLIDLLARGTNRRDIDHRPIPDLGYSLSLWSGDTEGDSFEVSVHIGSTSPHARNCFLLRLPSSGPHALHHMPATVQSLFNKLVRLLRASQGIVCEPSAIRWDGSVLAQDIPSLARHKNAA